MGLTAQVGQSRLRLQKSCVWFCVACVAPLALLSAGCGTVRAPLPSADVEAARRQADAVVREARAEAATLRKEMATTRIAVAKKEGELQELRRQVAELNQVVADLRQKETQLRQAHADQQQILEAKQADLAAFRNERDRLLQAKAESQAQLAELPQLRQSVSEAQARAGAAEAKVQAQVQELGSAVAALTAELAQVKQHLPSSQSRLPSKPGKPAKGTVSSSPTIQPAVIETPTDPMQAPGHQLSPLPETRVRNVPDTQAGRLMNATVSETGRPARLTVRSGESLWTIARRFGLTVDQLKDANGLDGDQITVGQQLVIPPAYGQEAK